MTAETLKKGNDLLKNIEELKNCKEKLENLLKGYHQIPGSIIYLKVFFGNKRDSEAEVIFGVECIEKSIVEYQNLINFNEKEFENLQ
jgi:hypothetical protein